MIRQKSGQISFLSGGQGKVILFLHGIPGSSQTWIRVAGQLSDNYKVLLPDLIGFGHSEQPAGDYYLKAQATALRELLEAQEITELYLAGHDFGGPVAITLLAMSPQLRILGLVLAATNVFTDTYVPLPLRLARIPLLNSVVFGAMVGNRIGLRLLYLAATKNKAAATWSQFQDHLTPSGVDFTRRIFQRSLADLKGNYQAVEDTLAQIDMPTLVLWGDKDPFFSVEVATRIQAAVPGAELKIYPATGHFVPEERPDDVARDMQAFL
jgi:pimeloyl-ACP methyl ester carboxylesterase